MEHMQHGEQGQIGDEPAEREAVCRTIAQEFALSESEFSHDIFLAADWPGEAEDGAIVVVKTGGALPSGGPEGVARSWMNVNDRLENCGVGLYCEVKGDTVTAFYRFY